MMRLYNRSKSTTDSSSDEGKKRRKIDKNERQLEIEHIGTILTSVASQIQIKENRIEKAKSVKDFKLCDQLYGDVQRRLDTVRKGSWVTIF